MRRLHILTFSFTRKEVEYFLQKKKKKKEEIEYTDLFSSRPFIGLESGQWASLGPS
jgi:hypothetical protein